MVSFGGVAAYLVLKTFTISSNNLGNPKLFVCIHFVSLYIFLIILQIFIYHSANFLKRIRGKRSGLHRQTSVIPGSLVKGLAGAHFGGKKQTKIQKDEAVE